MKPIANTHNGIIYEVQTYYNIFIMFRSEFAIHFELSMDENVRFDSTLRNSYEQNCFVIWIIAKNAALDRTQIRCFFQLIL